MKTHYITILLFFLKNHACKAFLHKNLITKQEKMVKLSNIKTEIENA